MKKKRNKKKNNNKSNANVAWLVGVSAISSGGGRAPGASIVPRGVSPVF